MKRILLCGALGKMGRQVAMLAPENGFEIAAGIDQSAEGTAAAFPVYPGFDSQIKEEADVIVDFSRPSALEGLLRYAVSKKLPCVLCSTGYGIALRDGGMALSAFYEFLVNVVFIGFGATIVLVWLRMPLVADIDGDGRVTDEERAEVERYS